MLKDLNLKEVYRSGYDNILEDFYVPALSVSKRYDRAVGYFSAATLCHAAQGLSSFCKSGGRIRLIVGAEIDVEDADTILEGYGARAAIDDIQKKLANEFESMAELGELFKLRQETLLWLVSNQLLDVKIALKKRGIFHEKIGVIYDENDDFLLFQGSANETVQGLVPGYNGESINVFESWNEHLAGHIRPHLQEFEDLWENEAGHTRTVEFSNALLRDLVKKAALESAPSISAEKNLFAELYSSIFPQSDIDQIEPGVPAIPRKYKGHLFELRKHQKDALGIWRANNYRGILAHATGSGKTVTAIFAAVNLYASISELGGKMALIIAVPYVNLADQWVDELALFNISATECYRSKAEWLPKARAERLAFNSGAKDFVCMVVVNKTLATDDFQDLIADFPDEEVFWIGDECHRHSSKILSDAVRSTSNFILGLSATPEHYADKEANSRLFAGYGDADPKSRYTLSDALNDGVLTPYRYFPIVVELTADECVRYMERTIELRPLAARLASGQSLSQSQRSYLDFLLLQRNRIIGSAENKFSALRDILAGMPPQKGVLIYCGDGSVEGDDEIDFVEPKRQIERVSEILDSYNWISSRFTSEENLPLRRSILRHFSEGHVHAMVAIRCLDEGIDIPMCDTAFILASSKNPRQFVQRRGRILRRSEGKVRAKIYDFVTKMPDDFSVEDYELEQSVFGSEIGRVIEFSSLAENSDDVWDALNEQLGSEIIDWHLERLQNIELDEKLTTVESQL